ncbi:MAG: lysophospholipid acyltransferase family protein [Planctomycetota bacterium]|nr:lysophospholipid acyltransferase family protein [Planctomycetota bacterium]
MKHTLEYLGVRFLDLFFGVLGPKLSMPIACALGTLIYLLLGKKRQIALDNLQLAFGDELTEQDRKRIAKEAFQNLVMNAAEFCLAHRLHEKGILDDYVEFKNAEIFDEALKEKRGAILIGAHYSNWELAGYTISLQITPAHSVVRTLKNPKVDRWVNGIREKSGQVIFPKEGALKSMIGLFREGKLLVFLLDQHAGDKGIPIDFFGHPAFTFDSVAMLSKRFNVPVIFGYDRRIGNSFKHVMTVATRIDPGDESVEELTLQYTKLIEDIIREQPGPWLWMHRRWKESNPSRRARKKARGHRLPPAC